MAEDISDKMSESTPKTDLSSFEFDSYQHQLEPYQHKVYKKRKPLTSPEIEAVEAIRAVIEPFSGQKRQEMYGEICNLIGFNSIRESYEHEKLLTEEWRRLMQHLPEMPPEEKTAAFARLDEIGLILEPEHRYL